MRGQKNQYLLIYLVCRVNITDSEIIEIFLKEIRTHVLGDLTSIEVCRNFLIWVASKPYKEIYDNQTYVIDM